jgi:hypothetical protein
VGELPQKHQRFRQSSRCGRGCHTGTLPC